MKIESIDRTSSVAYKGNEQNTHSKLSKNGQAEKNSDILESTVNRNNTVGSKQNLEETNPNALEFQPSEEHIRSVLSKAREKMNMSTSLEFSYHEATKTVSFKVIDKNTKQVVREIPPEKSLDMLQKMWELAGILIDEKR